MAPPPTLYAPPFRLGQDHDAHEQENHEGHHLHDVPPPHSRFLVSHSPQPKDKEEMRENRRRVMHDYLRKERKKNPGTRDKRIAAERHAIDARTHLGLPDAMSENWYWDASEFEKFPNNLDGAEVRTKRNSEVAGQDETMAEHRRRRTVTREDGSGHAEKNRSQSEDAMYQGVVPHDYENDERMVLTYRETLEKIRDVSERIAMNESFLERGKRKRKYIEMEVKKSWNVREKDELDSELAILGHLLAENTDYGQILAQEMKELQSRFKASLLRFDSKPHEERLLLVIGKVAIGESGLRLSSETVELIAGELACMPLRLVMFSTVSTMTFFDHFKGCVEDCFGETWNWWPLSPRLRPLQAGFCRLQWRTPAGAARHIDVPSLVKLAWQEVMLSAPAFLATTAPSKTVTSGQASPMSGTGATHSGSTSLQQADPYARTKATVDPSNTSRAGALSKRTTTAHVNLAQHIYICIATGSAFTFSDLGCGPIKKDLAFFAALKSQYLKARGRLRFFLSMWRYDRCEFYRVRSPHRFLRERLADSISSRQLHKHGVHSRSPVAIGFPEEADAHYDFFPRPPFPGPPDGPITEAEFRDHFYNPQHHHHTWQRAQKSRFFSNDSSALQALPKRKEQLELEDAKREYFYGLYARERRCFTWVAGYFFLCQVPSVIFFFLWLFQWKHASDLQGASVPASSSVTLSCCWLAYIIESREK